jgi:hypothetical protein
MLHIVRYNAALKLVVLHGKCITSIAECNNRAYRQFTVSSRVWALEAAYL